MTTRAELNAALASDKASKKVTAKLQGQARVAAVKNGLGPEARERAAYVKYGSAGIEAIHCKLCGQPLRELRPDDRFQERRTINGRDVIVERLALLTLQPYTEVRIDFDDGSHHVTCLCQECANSLTVEHLEAVYAMDMDVMQAEAGGFPWELYATRVPVAFEVFPPGKLAV